MPTRRARCKDGELENAARAEPAPGREADRPVALLTEVLADRSGAGRAARLRRLLLPRSPEPRHLVRGQGARRRGVPETGDAGSTLALNARWTALKAEIQ